MSDFDPLTWVGLAATVLAGFFGIYAFRSSRRRPAAMQPPAPDGQSVDDLVLAVREVQVQQQELREAIEELKREIGK